jgi:hypothetical protein
MAEPAQEQYEIKTEDKELHVINIMLESLSRHLHNNGDCTSEEYEQHLKNQRERVVRYVLDRVVTQG